MPEKDVLYVWPEEAASAMEWFTFPDAPELGTWYPGAARACTDIGLAPTEVADIVKRNDLPLKKTTGAVSKKQTPAGATGPSEDRPTTHGDEPGSPMPGMTADEFEAGVDNGDPVLVALAGGRQAPSGEPAPSPKPQTFGDEEPEPVK